MDMNLFPKRLETARKNAGLNQTELADKCGTTQSAISAFEHGSSAPNLGIAAAIADVLDVSLDWLCGGEMQNIRTLGDAARALAAIVDKISKAEFVKYDANGEYGLNPYFRTALTFSGELYSFLESLEKLRDLVETGGADRDVLDYWLDGRTRKLDQFLISNQNDKTVPSVDTQETV